MNKDTDCQNWNAGPDKIKRMCRPNTLTTNMQAYSLSQDSGRCLSTALMWGQRKADFHGHFLGQFCPGWQWCQHCRNLQRWDYSSKQWDYSSKRWDYSSKAARCNTEKAGHRNDWHIIAFFCFFFVHNSRLKGIQERENILSLLQMLNLAFAEEIFGLKMPWQLEQTTMVAQDSMLKQTKKWQINLGVITAVIGVAVNAAEKCR